MTAQGRCCDERFRAHLKGYDMGRSKAPWTTAHATLFNPHGLLCVLFVSQIVGSSYTKERQMIQGLVLLPSFYPLLLTLEEPDSRSYICRGNRLPRNVFEFQVYSNYKPDQSEMRALTCLTSLDADDSISRHAHRYIFATLRKLTYHDVPPGRRMVTVPLTAVESKV